MKLLRAQISIEDLLRKSSTDNLDIYTWKSIRAPVRSVVWISLYPSIYASTKSFVK